MIQMLINQLMVNVKNRSNSVYSRALTHYCYIVKKMINAPILGGVSILSTALKD